VSRISRECRVGTTTVWQWLQDPLFRQRIDELRREMLDRALGRLSDMMAGAAADTLLKLLGAESDSIKLDSAKAIYELFLHCQNAAELKSRIEALEQSSQPRGRPR
jgi:hypothetical protein